MAEPAKVNPHANPVPPAVAAAAAKAEALMATQGGQPPTAAPVADPLDKGTVDPQPAQIPVPEVPAAAEAPPGQTPQAAPEGAPQGETVEQAQLRAKRAEGRVASLNQQLNDQNVRIQRMEQLLATVSTPPAQGQPQNDGGTNYQKLVTPEEEAEYGADLMDVIGRKATEIAQRIVTEKLQPVENSLTAQRTVLAQDAVARFNANLKDAVPDYQTVDRDPEFLAWLAQMDPYSRKTRQSMLDEAARLHDAKTVINFFTGFKAEQAATTGGGTQTGSNPPPALAGAPAGKIPLENFAAPGKARQGSATSQAPQKATYSRADITKFYAEKTAGKWKGREADAAAIDADIFAAQQEGRIIN